MLAWPVGLLANLRDYLLFSMASAPPSAPEPGRATFPLSSQHLQHSHEGFPC